RSAIIRNSRRGRIVRGFSFARRSTTRDAGPRIRPHLTRRPLHVRNMEPLSIVKYPHPALRWKSKPIVEIDDPLRGAVAQMFRLMYEAKGIGLAANQVALPWRVFVINPSG